MRGPNTVAARPATRRRLMAGAAGLAGTAALAACAPGGTGGSEKPVEIKGPVTLRWSTWGNDQHPFNTDAAPKTLANFNKKFPNIKVEVEPQNTGWETKNSADWLAGTGVDLTGHCCAIGPDWGQQGMFLNLDPYIKRDAKAVPMGDYVEWLVNLFKTPERGQFALPMYTGTILLFFNKALFQRKGIPFPDDTWDWNKYRDVGIRVADVPNQVWARRDVGNGSMYRRVHQNGANIVDPKDNTKAAFASDKALAAFQYERDQIYRDGSVAQSGGPKEPDAFRALVGQFGGHAAIRLGKVAMWEGGSFTIIQYLRFLEDEVDWDVVPLPKGPTGIRTTLATSDGWSIWQGTKNKDAAWEFLKYLQSDEHTDIATRLAGQQSARKSHQQQWVKAFTEANPKLQGKALKWAADAIEKNYARPIEFWKKDAEAKTIYANAYNKAVRDGDAAVDTEMKAAADQINQLHR